MNVVRYAFSGVLLVGTALGLSLWVVFCRFRFLISFPPPFYPLLHPSLPFSISLWMLLDDAQGEVSTPRGTPPPETSPGAAAHRPWMRGDYAGETRGWRPSSTHSSSLFAVDVGVVRGNEGEVVGLLAMRVTMALTDHTSDR